MTSEITLRERIARLIAERKKCKNELGSNYSMENKTRKHNIMYCVCPVEHAPYINRYQQV